MSNVRVVEPDLQCIYDATQGVATQMSPVEAVATGIKSGIKQSTFFLEADQGIKTNSE